jgi:hypothetical protein
MGELRSRWANEPGHDRGRRPAPLGAASGAGIGLIGWPAILILAVAFLPGTMALTAAAQDEPPKVEAPKSAPPPPPDVPTTLESAPQDVQKKESAPDEKQKGAPTAPDEKDKQKPAPTAPDETPKPAPPAPEEAEKKAEPANPAVERAAAMNALEALSTSFKFVERYGIEHDPNRPQVLTQYRVGMIETTKYEIERAQGTPERAQRSRIIIYAERAAKVGKLGELLGLVRRYDTVVLRDLVQSRPLNPPLLQGLTVWYQLRPPLRPQIVSLSPDRPIREDEYEMIEGEVSMCNLSAFLPTAAKRVSETWEIAPSAVQIVSGRPPDKDGYEMTGTLERVTRSADGLSGVAQIGIAGKFDVEGKPGAFHAQIDFMFVPRGLATPARGAVAGASEVLYAEGSIKRALLSFIRVQNLPDSDGRLKHRHTIELTMERRPMALMPGERGPEPAPLVLPNPSPTPTESNSWVVFDDPEGRFHFEHPQEYLQVHPAIPVRSRFEFVDKRPGAGDAALILGVPAKTGNPASEQVFREPAGLQKSLDAEWVTEQYDVTRGPAGWLDDAAWKDSKRRVYRIEAALKLQEKKPLYADVYFVEFNQTQRIVVYSYTERADHLAIRARVEDVIKSFQWAPSRASAPAAATSAPAPGAAPAAASVPPGPDATPSTANPPAAPAVPPE